MQQFPGEAKFKYTWRQYQQRVLEELDSHLRDDHLHVVAPPGSGKTVLGLEVALRLNKPTLIFAPTIAIRNQWIQRFCELFLQSSTIPEWISRDIKNPRFMTVSTYQGLHAAFTGEEELDDYGEEGENERNVPLNAKSGAGTKEVIQLLKDQRIGTIVVDEAHHLKKAWWESLTKVKNALNPTIVGLTATPPYDVSPSEWSRYTQLNGPVDAEISVPELVVADDLCPHQDYVILSSPTDEERKKIEGYREQIEILFNELKTDSTLAEALEKHSIYQNPKAELEWIYSNIECYAATLIFLNAVGKEITPMHLEIIGDKKFKIPELDYQWMETLLEFYLFKRASDFNRYEVHQEQLANRLRKYEALDMQQVKLRSNRSISSSLTSSISKLDSIDQIVDFEHSYLGDSLRMVILTDFIRKEFLANGSRNDLELNKIGVVPIFEQLRRTNQRNMKIGVLTGSIVIIPLSAMEAFKEVATQYNIHNISTSPISYDPNYLIIHATERLRHDIVHIITQVFQKGYIEVLVGTKSLLGEGWDAPAINSLILASFVGSYVLSNQMRGRAIRTERQNVDKTSNIWHLVCIDPTSPDGGDDLQLLKRRFHSFVGVSLLEETVIQNGIKRLGLPHEFTDKGELHHVNLLMFDHAEQRGELKKKWQKALEKGDTLVEEIKVPFPEDQSYMDLKSFYYNKTIAYSLSTLISGFFGGLIIMILYSAPNLLNTPLEYFLKALGIGILMLLFSLLIQLFKIFRLYVRYRDISEDFHQIGVALLKSLIYEGAVNTGFTELTVVSEVDDDGAIYCHLKGGTTHEKSLFIKSLYEIIDTIDNPRYIIIRKSFFLKILSQKDYHAVPEILGRKRKLAAYFEHQWANLVGSCELIYTRTLEGRKMLLKSRMKSLSSTLKNDEVEMVNEWQ